MADKRKQQQSAIKDIISGADRKQPTQAAEADQDPVTAKGIGLRASEWAQFEAIAEEMGSNRHAVAAWALRDFLKRYEAGEIQTVKKPTLPGL